ncbi:MAG: glycosyltransferase family 2 protein [Oscillospiraceae bacterium]|jgi:dolichol-phosphate mannosyltransferase|nr:glycosyltransferase family 2 protein [Oscillospiraceae bacterium]
MLSIIIPTYNEAGNIKTAADTILAITEAANIDAELLFADDGSTDGSWEIIKSLHQQNPSVRGIRFSRNFGKEGAIFAGLANVSGDCALLIDCDLQHPPSLIPEMYRLWEEGAEIVAAVKSSRGRESVVYKAFAKMFYSLMKSSSKAVDLENASDFKLLDRKVVDSLVELPERLTFFRALSGWVGFKTVKIPFEVQERTVGTSKWSFTKLFKFALSNLTGFTSLPLSFITVAGIIYLVFSLVLGGQTLVNFFTDKAADGFTTVILLLLITGGFLMTGLGILGYYLSKIYEEVKYRPRYIISDTTPEPRLTDKNV